MVKTSCWLVSHNLHHSTHPTPTRVVPSPPNPTYRPFVVKHEFQRVAVLSLKLTVKRLELCLLHSAFVSPLTALPMRLAMKCIEQSFANSDVITFILLPPDRVDLLSFE